MAEPWEPSRLQETLAGIELLLRDIRHHLQSDGAASGWSKVGKTLQDIDEEKIRYCKEDIDTLLTFAGLFSAALTAFLVESYTQLSEDPTVPIVQLLTQLVAQTQSFIVTDGRISSAASAATAAQPFEPPTSAICVNVLWFASLVISLVTASFGILIKQWLREYATVSNPQHTSLRARLRIRQFRNPALATWRVFEIAAVLPLLIQIALGLFLLGLCFFTWAVHTSIGSTTTPLVSAWFVFFVAAALAPVVSSDCPYKITLLAPALRAIRRLVCSTRLTKRLYRGHLVPTHLLHDNQTEGGRHPMSLSRLVAIHPLNKIDFRSHDKNLLPRAITIPEPSVPVTVPLEEDQVARDEGKDQAMLVTVDNALLDDELLATTMIPLLRQNQATRSTMMTFILTTITHRVPHLRSAKDNFYQTTSFERMSERTWSVFIDLIITILGSDMMDDTSADDAEWLQGTLAVLNSCPDGYSFNSAAVSIQTRATRSLFQSIVLQRARSPSLPLQDIWTTCLRIIPAKSFKPVTVMSMLLSSQYCRHECRHSELYEVVRSHHERIAAGHSDADSICKILGAVLLNSPHMGGRHHPVSSEGDLAQMSSTLAFLWLTEHAPLDPALKGTVADLLRAALPNPQEFYTTMLHALALRIPKLRCGPQGYQRVELAEFKLKRDVWDFYMILTERGTGLFPDGTIEETGGQTEWIEGTVAVLQSFTISYPLTERVESFLESRLKQPFLKSVALKHKNLGFKGIWPIVTRTFSPNALARRTNIIYELLQNICCNKCDSRAHPNLLELLVHHVSHSTTPLQSGASEVHEERAAKIWSEIQDVCDALDHQFQVSHWTQDLEESLLVFLACLREGSPLYDSSRTQKILDMLPSGTPKFPFVLEPMLNAFARRVPAFRTRIGRYCIVPDLTGLSRITWDLYLDVFSQSFNVLSLRRSRPDLLEGMLAFLNSSSADYPLTSAAEATRELLAETFVQSMREFVQVPGEGHDIPDVLPLCTRTLTWSDLNDPTTFVFDLLSSHYCRNTSPPCVHESVYETIEAHGTPETRLDIAKFLVDHIRQTYPQTAGVEWQSATLASFILLCKLIHHLNQSELGKYEKPRSLVSMLLRQPVVALPSFGTEAVEALLWTPRVWIRTGSFNNVPQSARQTHLQNLVYLLGEYSAGSVAGDTNINILSCCEISLEALHTVLKEIPLVVREDVVFWEEFAAGMATALRIFLSHNNATNRTYSQSAIRCLGTCTNLLLQTRKFGQPLVLSELVDALHEYLVLPYDDLKCLRDLVADTQSQGEVAPGRLPLSSWPEASDSEEERREGSWIEDDNSSFYF